MLSDFIPDLPVFAGFALASIVLGLTPKKSGRHSFRPRRIREDLARVFFGPIRNWFAPPDWIAGEQHQTRKHERKWQRPTKKDSLFLHGEYLLYFAADCLDGLTSPLMSLSKWPNYFSMNSLLEILPF